MYNYYLGGKDNYAVDRIAAAQVIARAPEGVHSRGCELGAAFPWVWRWFGFGACLFAW
jgi:hypothetical protein